MLAVQLETKDMPWIFSEFRRIIGEEYWVNRARQIRSEIQGSPYLRDLLIRENEIPLVLDDCTSIFQSCGTLPLFFVENRKLYPTFAFAAQILSLLYSAKRRSRNALIRRVQGALSNIDDLRGLRLELTAATHFIRRGCDIVFPEMEGSDTFDIFVPELSSNGLEVECKSISEDKGKKIHRREALLLWHKIADRLDPLMPRANVGVFIVVSIPDRLPQNPYALNGLVSSVVESYLEGASGVLNDGTYLRIGTFEPRSVLRKDETGQLRIYQREFEKITRTSNREAMIIGRGNNALLLVIQSQKSDKVLDATFDTLRRSARTQLTGRRASIFVVCFEGITNSQLAAVARDDSLSENSPSALRIKVSEFMKSKNREHVVGVNFIAKPALSPKEAMVISSGGVAYFFPKTESKYWHKSLHYLFDQ